MNDLLKKLEKSTSRTLRPGVRSVLRDLGLLQPEWEERDQVKPLPEFPLPQQPGSFRIPGRVPQPQEEPYIPLAPEKSKEKTMLLVELLRDLRG